MRRGGVWEERRRGGRLREREKTEERGLRVREREGESDKYKNKAAVSVMSITEERGCSQNE